MQGQQHFLFWCMDLMAYASDDFSAPAECNHTAPALAPFLQPDSIFKAAH